MPRGKKKANGNGHKPLSYKFGPREGGSVVFSGPINPEDVPPKVVKTLDKFGMGHFEGLKWKDETLPVGEDVYEELERLASLAELTIETKPPATKRGGPTYTVSMGTGDTVQGKSLTEALIKAHRAWNRGGRVVGGKALSSAIDSAIS